MFFAFIALFGSYRLIEIRRSFPLRFDLPTTWVFVAKVPPLFPLVRFLRRGRLSLACLRACSSSCALPWRESLSRAPSSLSLSTLRNPMSSFRMA